MVDHGARGQEGMVMHLNIIAGLGVLGFLALAWTPAAGSTPTKSSLKAPGAEAPGEAESPHGLVGLVDKQWHTCQCALVSDKKSSDGSRANYGNRPYNICARTVGGATLSANNRCEADTQGRQINCKCRCGETDKVCQ